MWGVIGGIQTYKETIMMFAAIVDALYGTSTSCAAGLTYISIHLPKL